MPPLLFFYLSFQGLKMITLGKTPARLHQRLFSQIGSQQSHQLANWQIGDLKSSPIAVGSTAYRATNRRIKRRMGLRWLCGIVDIKGVLSGSDPFEKAALNQIQANMKPYSLVGASVFFSHHLILVSAYCWGLLYARFTDELKYFIHVYVHIKITWLLNHESDIGLELEAFECWKEELMICLTPRIYPPWPGMDEFSAD